MNLLEKLLEIRKAMPYLKKEAKNKGQGFFYVSSSQVLQIFRQKADELAVLFVPRIVMAKMTKPEGQKQLLTQLTIEYEIINVEDPSDFIKIAFYAQGMDMGEKGVGKALTYGEKYLILKLFNIPTDVDDPDGQPPPESGKQEEPREDDDTTRFLAAMETLRKGFTKRDGNDNAVNMMTKVLGFKEDNAITEIDERKKVVLALLEELGVGKVSDVVI